jgi:hypothetical protein
LVLNGQRKRNNIKTIGEIANEISLESFMRTFVECQTTLEQIEKVRHNKMINSTSPIQDNIKTFDTGAVRSNDCDDVRYDLISPIGLEEVARTCHEGACKYSPMNWERGLDISSLLNHAIRHIYLYLSGDRSESHLGHAAWNVMAAIHSEKLWPELNKGKLRGPGCTPPNQDEQK